MVVCLTSQWSGRLRAAHFGAAQRRVRQTLIGRAELIGRTYSEMKNYIADSDYRSRTIRVPSATSTTGTVRQLEHTWALEEQGAINDLEPYALEDPLFKCPAGFEATRR